MALHAPAVAGFRHGLLDRSEAFLLEPYRRAEQAQTAILYGLIILYNQVMSVQPTGRDDEYQIRELPASEARSRLSELLDAVANGEFVYLTRRGRRVAALMPADIAENYEKIEDEYWARRAREARERLAAGEDEIIPFDQLVAEAEGAHGQA
jgi:prevent-host-death family protein